jgi:hypothetical protein
MPEGALILDRMYFEKPEWRCQAKEAGFSRAAAWLDILALCNQKSTVATVRGIQVSIERGECARSKLGLADRWGRSQNWVTTTLAMWEKDGRVQVRKSDNETTVIFVTNFDAWQTGLASTLRAEGEQKESRSRATGEQKETEIEKEKEYRVPRRDREGEEEPGKVFPELVSDECMLEFGRAFEGEPSSGSPPMSQEWVVEFIRRLNGRREMPRDWRRLMVASWRAEWRDWLQKKPAAANGSGLSANVAAIQDQNRLRQVTSELKTLEDEIHQDRLSNLPRDPEKIGRVRKLREQLKGVEA